MNTRSPLLTSNPWLGPVLAALFALSGCGKASEPLSNGADFPAERALQRSHAASSPRLDVKAAPMAGADVANAPEELAHSSEKKKLVSIPGASPMPIAGPATGTTAQKEALKPADDFNTERYTHLDDNPFVPTSNAPLSTFSIDVDTASYSNVRRMLQSGSVVVPGAVRIEEMINYFSYDYPQPQGEQPFSVTTELAAAPWHPDHQLLLIGLQGKQVLPRVMPARNLVFLLDVSGSMQSADKLPLLKRSFAALLDTLNERDRVAIVVYAGASGLVLPATAASNRQRIFDALDALEAGGSTNGGAGIELAYQVAQASASAGSINRVILATDGDFNVGTSSESELVRLIEEKRKQDVFLTVLGFGTGNYNDSTLESLADKGNGNYAYIDTYQEAHKVLVREAGSTLLTIAKDVKIQVEFNPAVVGAYRLIGYENRRLADRDFNDDTKDAGDIGAGHSVTALYEVMSPEQAKALIGVDALKYQKPGVLVAGTMSDGTQEIATVKLRYKQPDASTSQLLTVPVSRSSRAITEASTNLRFAASVAAFGMILRRSEHRGSANVDLVRQLAQGAVGSDPYGYRREFISLLALPGSAGGQ